MRGPVSSCSRLPSWNEKHLDCEIETEKMIGISRTKFYAWNEKHLDCEIETFGYPRIARGQFPILKWKASRLRDWNSYNFDRQIPVVHLKWKASRLRDWNKSMSLPTTGEACPAWNEKHLDCEIETRNWSHRLTFDGFTWNEKHLDCEIETTKYWRCRQSSAFPPEMKSISIARLKHNTADPA